MSLTAADDHPDKVEEEVVEPEVVPLGPAVLLVKEARAVVQDVAVDLAHRDDELEGVPRGVLRRDAVRDEEGQGAPGELRRNHY